MKFTDEVTWDGRDFITAGALLLGTGLVCELVIRYRIAVCAVILAAPLVVLGGTRSWAF
jgi:hypothetical protein